MMPLRDAIRVALPPLAVAIGFTVLAYLAAGGTLAFFFAGFFFIALLLPAMVLTREAWLERLFIAGAVVDGIGGTWLVVILLAWIDGASALAQTRLLEWLGLYALLATFAAAVCGLVLILRRLRMGDILAGVIAMLIGLLWLSWPVWLSRALTAELTRLLTPAHPLLACNPLLAHLGIWTEQPLAYHLTTLGQHVPYQLPGPWLALGLHLLLAAMMLGIARLTSPAGATS